MAFLYENSLQDHFQLNIEPNHTTLAGHEAAHDVYVASIYGKLGKYRLQYWRHDAQLGYRQLPDGPCPNDRYYEHRVGAG